MTSNEAEEQSKAGPVTNLTQLLTKWQHIPHDAKKTSDFPSAENVRGATLDLGNHKFKYKCSKQVVHKATSENNYLQVSMCTFRTLLAEAKAVGNLDRRKTSRVASQHNFTDFGGECLSGLRSQEKV